MAHTELLPEAVLNTVASQVGKLLPRVVGRQKLADAQIELGETFPVWMLGANATTRTDEDIGRLAMQTGRWHHQVRFGGKAEAFARSIPLGADHSSWDVREFFESEIAKAIEEAITWVDRNTKGNPEVRLLIVPAYYLHAFWLLENGTNQVLVIDMPKQFTHLQRKKLYTPKEFLEALAKEQHAAES